MATLILGTIGRVFAGPLGGLVGTALGGVVDRGLLGGGGGRGREVGRTGNLAVQSAAYGEPIPVISGTMRVAGNLLWTSGIAEASTRSGGGKRSGPATTTYSYSASFAVGLAGCRIAAVGRIWADGKLIRDAGGVFLTPVTMRLHDGSEAQPADPLIAAFEAEAGAPAYRGIAYVVFEDLPLGDYGNRIPNLTFEIIADAARDAGAVLARLATVDGRAVLAVSGGFPAIEGHFAGRSGSVGDAIAPLMEMAGAALSSRDELTVRGEGGDAVVIAADDCEAQRPGSARVQDRRRRLGGETQPGTVEIAFYDRDRDFQPGLQRARRDPAGPVDHQAIACAMTAGQAKTIAVGLLARSQAARLRATLRLPWRYVGIAAGDRVMVTGEDVLWRVREVRFEGFVVDLDVERVEVVAPVTVPADGGRVPAVDDGPAGATRIEVLDLPPLPGEVPVLPRLWIAAAGAAPQWRRAAVEASGDDGASYAVIGVAEATVMGAAVTRLGDGPTAGWDRLGSVEVELLSERMWLEGRTEAMVLAGANLALLGDEVIQFAAAEAVAPGRFRLSGLLRGRRGSEAAVAGHAVGERFVLLDPATLLAFDPPVETLGREYRFRAAGVGDAASVPVAAVASGRVLRPLSPVHLRLRIDDGDVAATWVRRSRGGFGWPDFVDAPVAEAREAYRVEVLLDGVPVRSEVVGGPGHVYGAAERLADGGGAAVTVRVAQISEAVGPGEAATATITF